MRIFLFILTNNIIPIFALICMGILIDRKFHLDVSTLSKINLYFFVPAFVFVNIYTTKIPLDMLKALGVVILILAINWIYGTVIGKLRRFDVGMTNAFVNSIMFYNSGNFGVPLITLIYSSKPFIVDGETPYLDFALTVQVIVLIVQNLSTNNLGVFNASKASGGVKVALKKALTLPAPYFVIAAFLLKLLPYDLTQFPLWPAFNYVRNGLVAVALLTMGVQLSQTKFHLKNPDVYLSVFSRLIMGPVFAFILVLLFGIKGIMAQVLIISSGCPTAINTALISVEFKNHPDFASQVVMVATLLSAITLTGVIYFATQMFPV
ncbi:auxin efflux carrier [Thermoclostridium stercorarium subsp. stercorarium DSM 8532]|jgi:predicted permease|uniref:Auxin efflux carrier n=3 Tax=Thermoclostridium stercorarium TaxID=1510 RepID=L7VH15_THES1|nr:AEC family transporter [Thermoclostridium stercorarium]AGC67285.1 auxin efflux carrier [Thermoclostridium stercorarium subsp. stercorarium DSM 8532]AGI38351.1 permease [Thermoclostridium stercorarium subsp. stercorarium DSM 8532]ANW97788.1 transporter [Thermoclostridium stercorarium subsp. thermolacticum DSM 2910]ANX00314.1 transporter [Thermoclostridium stercorarium subsp. leptospartum DSM 9219]UZQ85862.1 AEC family transporter [Thermoclostridium stercorarium]